ncbi:MAG: alpha-amylase/4-alpha-glucanotransferase domain-containing protein [Planctomycetota bacterium]
MIAQKIARLVLGFHCHQPVGNFDGVFAQNFETAYKPLIETFAEFPAIKFNLHISGPLWEWVEANRPCFFNRIAELLDRGQLELLGGAWSEPILPMIPRRDRIGQIRHFNEIITRRFGKAPRGMWLAERVWEQDLVESLARSGMEYTVLDDYHFHRAGLDPAKLGGYFLTEDQGHLLRLFPNSEPLRYLVPWQEPDKTIEHLLKLAESGANPPLAITADDGEKFGGWPGTYELIYGKKWLARFLTLLEANQEQIQTSTFSQILKEFPPLGRIYVPPASYREMTEWVLPPERLELYQRGQKNLELADADFALPIQSFFAPGGYWRNFLVKYPESAEMAAHMRSVSQTIARIENAFQSVKSNPTTDQQLAIDSAKLELYRAQCNCPYWHGAFGGLYMPHLRNAIYRHLILAENHIDRILAPAGDYIRCLEMDFNADTKIEIRLDNRHLIAWISPAQGGQIYELDDRRTATNILATLNRRFEPYHHAVAKAAREASKAEAQEGPSNLHDRITLKQPGLDQLLVYDRHPRKALVDHLWPATTTAEQWRAGLEQELTAWPTSEYHVDQNLKTEDSCLVVLSQESAWNGRVIRIKKEIGIHRQANALEIGYELNGLAGLEPHRFAVEINMAAMAGHEDDRQFRDHSGRNLGKLDSSLTLVNEKSITLVDEWLDLASRLEWQEFGPEEVWTLPIRTVSNSEGGYESVFQSSAIAASWLVGGGSEDSFRCKFRWVIKPSREMG